MKAVINPEYIRAGIRQYKDLLSIDSPGKLYLEYTKTVNRTLTINGITLDGEGVDDPCELAEIVRMLRTSVEAAALAGKPLDNPVSVP